MPLKVKIDTEKMNKYLPDARKTFAHWMISEDAGGEINRQIQSGLSPVEGVARYKEYSDSYKRYIEENDGVVKGTDGKWNTGKRIRPVNLYVSGTMLGSQVVTNNDDRINIKYTSKFAGYHNDGGGNLPKRPLLPTQLGSKFSRTLTRFILDIAKRSVNLIIH